MSNPLGNFEGDVNAWRIVVSGRGPLTGVRYYTPEIQSSGQYSGGETDGKWFDLAEYRHDDKAGCDLLAYLLENHRHVADEDSITLAEDILIQHNREIPTD